MAKQKTQYYCKECGGITAKWQGQCPHCFEWNTLEEGFIEPKSTTQNRYSGITTKTNKIETLSDVEASDYIKKTTSNKELDRVLGGGLVDGGVILLGGEPGVGKSTLLIQVLGDLAKKQKVLYVSGEESSHQIALRANRLNINTNNIRIYGEIELEKIIQGILTEKPNIVVIDSIQTIFSNLMTSAPGSVSQVKECAAQLNRMAKEQDISLIIIGHVTKDGDVAGPRVLEHIVDTVLFFEGEQQSQYRVIRSLKNRFGPTNEIGVFAMTEKGLQEINDPSNIFLINNSNVVGSCITPVMEGNRSILVEVQSLLDESPLPNPIRRCVGFDVNRLSMLVAIIHKYLHIPIYQQNVFVGVIGGIRISDPSIDLPIFLSMVSSFRNKSLPPNLIAFGEIGLTGELRLISNIENRVKESARMGFKIIFMPHIDKKEQNQLEKKYSVQIFTFKRIADVIVELKNMEN